MKKLFLLFFTVMLVLMFPGCTKSNDGNGRLVVKVTDAPFPIDMVQSATVTISKVELRKEGDGINDGSPFLTVWEGSATFNLLELRNGLVEQLMDVTIPQGNYDLVRLYVDEAGLKIKDGGDYDVKVPSGPQTGIKIFIDPVLSVEGGLTSELLLDIDLSKSFVLRGNADSPAGIIGFIFKPVIRAVNSSTAGSLEGLVTDSNKAAIAGASISVKQGDNEVVTGITDDNGHYVIPGVTSGTYSVSASKENFQTVTTSDVKIVAGNKTVLDFVLSPL
ncbi:MAG: DUF4382 domain-containing protein [Bacteroidota bacterium]|nr:DUF4382 domain-containing protein [Bacteroidota bacterium]